MRFNIPLPLTYGGSALASGYAQHLSVRPFVQVDAKLPEPPRARPLLPGEGEEAFFSWGGGSSQLQVAPLVNPVEDANADSYAGGSSSYQTRTTDPVTGATSPVNKATHGQKKQPQKPKPQDNKQGVLSLNEIDRATETITVYKPGDNTVWMNVQRIRSIRFRAVGGPIAFRGMIFKMNLKPPPPPKRPEDPE
jgi:hypothetical protein